jgi:hypothetical protein
MAKEKPLPDVAEQDDELSLIDEELDRALDGLKTANEKVVDLLEHIEGTSQEGDPDGEEPVGTGEPVPQPVESGNVAVPSEEHQSPQGETLLPDSP